MKKNRHWIRYNKNADRIDSTFSHPQKVPTGKGWEEFLPPKECVTVSIPIPEVSGWAYPSLRVTVCGQTLLIKTDALEVELQTIAEVVEYLNQLIYGIGRLYIKDGLLYLSLDKCYFLQLNSSCGTFTFEVGDDL